MPNGQMIVRKSESRSVISFDDIFKALEDG